MSIWSLISTVLQDKPDFHPLHRIPEALTESGPDKAVQEREGGIGLEEHPAEEVLRAEEGPGDVREENLEVEESFDKYDSNENSSFVGTVHKEWKIYGNGPVAVIRVKAKRKDQSCLLATRC